VTPEERAWEVVRLAFEERIPNPRRTSPSNKVLLGVIAAAVLVGAVISPPGRAVLGDLRESVGVEHAAPALFTLPAPGRLLVVSAEGGGAWVVNADGSRRRLGDFQDARWSPHGLYVVATRRNELSALEPDGDERWSLARRDVSEPRWTGSRTDTRIAYCSGSALRVVGGNGVGDRLLDARGCGATAWRPGPRHVLTYADGTVLVTEDVDARRVLWRHEGSGRVEWSTDGRRLLVSSPHRLDVLGANGRTFSTLRFRENVLGAAFAPGSHALAVHLRAGEGERAASEVRLVGAGASRRLFAATGAFGDIAWSPNGQWLLVAWPSANQWLFIPRARGRLRAVGNISAQFPPRGDVRPMLLVAGRWCCPP